MKINPNDVKMFFTSDTHFRHKSIQKFCPDSRGTDGVNEHDRRLIRNWQSQVQPDDLVFILGDFSFGDADETRRTLDQLPGQKILIYGNHDKVIRSDYSLQKMFHKCTEYMRIHVEEFPIILFHYPIYEWDMIHRGAFHLHGHVHGSLDSPKVIPGRVMDVGIDSRPSGDMMLWTWEEIKRTLVKEPIREHH